MEKKIKVEESCCACEADFKKEVESLVDEVEGYDKNDHDKKRREVNDAFGEKKERK